MRQTRESRSLPDIVCAVNVELIEISLYGKDFTSIVGIIIIIISAGYTKALEPFPLRKRGICREHLTRL